MAAEESGFQLSGNAAERYEQAISLFMLPWSAHLVDQADLAPGMRVLDLACGTGFATRAASQIVGESGVVAGVDINPLMVVEARRITGLQIYERPAESTELADESFDVVLCQQGLQFFPNPTAGLAEAARVLNREGRLLASVWDAFDDNPYFLAQFRAFEPHLEPEEINAYKASDITALGGQAGLLDMLEATGFRNVTVERHTLWVDFPAMASFFPMVADATPFGPSFQALSEDEQTAAVERMSQTVGAMGRDHPVTVPMHTWLAEASQN